MKLTQEQLDNGVLKLSPEGAMDVSGSAFLDPSFAMVAEQSKRVIVDMSGVSFLASIGLRVLVKTAKTLAQQSGRIAVYAPQEAPKKVILATGVDKLINLADDEDDAVAVVTKFDG